MRNDGIFPITRIVAAIVIPFLFTAFVILFFLPHRSGELFAWPIKPDMSAMYFGSAYLGGAWLLANAAVGREWHRVHVVFPAITVFTGCMLIATFLHWDKFSHGRPAFTAWLVLYMITPFLVPAVWLYNRRTDPRQPQAGQGFVSKPLRIAAQFLEIIVLA